jgi:hypothetical protein
MDTKGKSWEISRAAIDSWHLLSQRLAEEPDKKLRSNLAIVKQHILAEVAGDLDSLMATMIPEPEYEFFGESMYGARQVGHGPVRFMYQRANETGRNRREIEISHVVVDPYSVVTEGKLRLATRGSDLLQSSPSIAGEIREECWYVTEDTTLIIWPINPDGLIVGERVYLAEVNHVMRELQEGECPHLGPVVRS